MGTYPTKPYNLVDFRVIENVAAGDYTVSKNQLHLNVNGNVMNVNWNDILPSGFIRTAYAAGTAQITTIDTTAATLTAGVTTSMTLKRLDNNNTQQLQVVMVTGETAATLKTKFVTAVNNLGGTNYTAVSTGANTLTITEVGNIGGFVTTMSDTGITVVVGTPHVNSSGTLPEVQQYLPTAAGSNYCKYQFVTNTVVPGASGQASALRNGQYIVWVESNDAQFAATDAVLVSIMDGTYIAALADTQPFIEKI